MMYKEAAGLAAKRGYTRVMTFKEGIPGWVKAGFSLDTQHALPGLEVSSLGADEVKGLLDKAIILDVRTPSLYGMGCIKGSYRIPLEHLSDRFSEIPKGRKIIVVDHAGKQVLVAGRFLKTKGYEDVERLQGGLMAWMTRGFALEK